MDNLKRILATNSIQLTFCLALGLAILIGTNWPLVIGRFVDPALLEKFVAPEVKVPAQVFGNELVPKLVVALFWGTIGLIAYTLVWGLVNMIIEARNEVTLETAYVNKGRLDRRLTGPLIQMGLALLLFGVLIITALATIPLWVNFFADFLIVWKPVALLYLLGSVVGTTINIYLIWVLIRAVFRAD